MGGNVCGDRANERKRTKASETKKHVESIRRQCLNFQVVNRKLMENKTCCALSAPRAVPDDGGGRTGAAIRNSIDVMKDE